MSANGHPLEAVTSFGLNETDLRENISVFQKTWLDPHSGSVSLAKSEARRSDYIEYYAEMDLLVAVSVCPLGDGAVDPTAPGPNAVRPLGIEIRETGIAPKPFPRWTDWRPAWKGRRVPPAYLLRKTVRAVRAGSPRPRHARGCRPPACSSRRQRAISPCVP